DLLAGLAGIVADHLLEDRAHPLIGGLRLRQPLEALLGLLADVGAERRELGALLDLVGGDGLVVDEDDDGLLGPGRRRRGGGSGLTRRLLLLGGQRAGHGRERERAGGQDRG